MVHFTNTLVGTHILSGGNLSNAFAQAYSLGCSCFQIFTHSNRQWAFTLPKTSEVDLFLEQQSKYREKGVMQVVAHASYLINPSSPDKEIQEKSLNLLKKELACCEMLNIPYLVLHPGSRIQSSQEDALKACAQTISRALDTQQGKTIIALENMAGQGSTIGTKLEDLAQVYHYSDHKDRIGFCIDTCHAHAAGYNLITKQGYDAFWKECEETIQLSKVHCIHINDSIKDKGSRVDRHTHIGDGTMALEPFKLLMQDSRFFKIAKILETPKDDNKKTDKTNLDLLQSFLSK